MRYTLANNGGHHVTMALQSVTPVSSLPDVLRPFLPVQPGTSTNTVTLHDRAVNRVLTALYALGWRHA